MWPEESTDTDKITEEAEIRAEKKVSSLKSEIDKELLKMFRKQKITDEKLSSTRDEMRHLIDKTISSSRRLEIEAREETVRDQIRRLIKMQQRVDRKVSADTIVQKLGRSLSPKILIDEIEEMAREGELSLSERPIGPRTIIRLIE